MSCFDGRTTPTVLVSSKCTRPIGGVGSALFDGAISIDIVFVPYPNMGFRPLHGGRFPALGIMMQAEKIESHFGLLRQKGLVVSCTPKIGTGQKIVKR